MAEQGPLDMDALTAHLDRGWGLLARGELLAARVSAQHILQSHPDSADGHTLWGAICTAEADHEEAFDSFRRALDADPEHLDAMLYAAELAISSQGDTGFALQLCDEASELAVEPDDVVEIGLLRAEAHLVRGEPAVARKWLSSFPDAAGEPGQLLRMGRALIEADRPREARAPLTKACEAPEAAADAHYLLGVAHEGAGALDAALAAFVRVQELDHDAPRPGWTMPGDGFELAVQEALRGLPSSVTELVDGVAVHRREGPPLEMIYEGVDPRAGVYIAGAAPDDRGEPSVGGSAPGRRAQRGDAPRAVAVFVYQRNIEKLAGSPAGVTEEIRRCMGIEAASLLGLDPGNLDQLGERGLVDRSENAGPPTADAP